jgi:hypothetical protein
MWQISAGAYARGVSAALALAIASLALVAGIYWYIGDALGYYMSLSVIVGLGFLLGRTVKRATGGKRGRKLQWVAGTGTAVAGLGAGFLIGIGTLTLLAIVVATYLAVRTLEI